MFKGLRPWMSRLPRLLRHISARKFKEPLRCFLKQSSYSCRKCVTEVEDHHSSSIRVTWFTECVNTGFSRAFFHMLKLVSTLRKTAVGSRLSRSQGREMIMGKRLKYRWRGQKCCHREIEVLQTCVMNMILCSWLRICEIGSLIWRTLRGDILRVAAAVAVIKQIFVIQQSP